MNSFSILHIPPRSLERIQHSADQTRGHVQGVEQQGHGQGQGCGDACLGEKVDIPHSRTPSSLSEMGRTSKKEMSGTNSKKYQGEISTSSERAIR